MSSENEFARQNPALDQALREQIKAPKMDGAFRQQVFARIAAERAALARLAAAPDAESARLRAQFVLQVLNIGGIALVTVLLLRVLWPTVGSAWPALAGSMASQMQQGGIVLAFVAAIAALCFGLQRARLLDWVRNL